MRWLLWKLGLVQLVVLVDNYNNTPNIRILRIDAKGFFARRHPESLTSRCYLKPDGTCEGALYIKRWEPYRRTRIASSGDYRTLLIARAVATGTEEQRLTLGED